MHGGFGGPGGGFSNDRNSGKATTATKTKKPLPGPPKPPGKFQRLKPHAADPGVKVLGFQILRLEDCRLSI